MSYYRRNKLQNCSLLQGYKEKNRNALMEQHGTKFSWRMFKASFGSGFDVK
jgi:hypothetical protein